MGQPALGFIHFKKYLPKSMGQPAQEVWYYVGQGGEVSKAVAVRESTGIQIRDKAPDQDLVTALTSSDGPLASGAAPKIGKLSEAGEKAVLESLVGEGQVAKASKKRKASKEEKEAEVVGPKTPLEHVVAAKTEILKAATEARKYALALEHVQYSGELVSKLMTFSQKMESVYKKVTTLESQGCKDEDRFQKILDIINEQMKWYGEAEASKRDSSECRPHHFWRNPTTVSKDMGVESLYSQYLI